MRHPKDAAPALPTLVDLGIRPLSGAELKAWREGWRINGRIMTQTELADLLGVEQPAISRWENDGTMWNPIALALALYALETLLLERGFTRGGLRAAATG